MHSFLTLKQAAAHVHMPENELRHVAQRGEIDAVMRGDDWYFEHCVLDEWAQRSILSSAPRETQRRHDAMVAESRRRSGEAFRVSSLFDVSAMDLHIGGKAKAGIVRDMSDLAARSGAVYDADGLYSELMEREAAASTAVGEGAAFLHPRFHDPYLFERSFIAYGRSERPVFFGAPDGSGTRHFFLVCSTDHAQHLQILARLAVMTHATDFLRALDEVSSREEAISAIRSAEEAFP